MYIFKQPRIGGEVTPHQDSCFLRTDPPSCIGLWLALEDATMTNGCLWARPGSHTEPIRRHFAKQPDGTMGFDARLPAHEPPPPQMAWEGRMPAGAAQHRQSIKLSSCPAVKLPSCPQPGLPTAVPDLGACASSGRAWRLRVPRLSHGERRARPPGRPSIAVGTLAS